jgi:hypothetical protein
MDMFSKRVLKPKIATIANKVDNDLANACAGTRRHHVGTPGTGPPPRSVPAAGAWLDTEAVPRDGERSWCWTSSPRPRWSVACTGLFNPQVQLGEQYKKGQMSKETLGFNWYMDQNISTQTNKALAVLRLHDHGHHPRR